MNDKETILLAIAIVILVILIIYSLVTSKRFEKPKSPESQSLSLKSMLDEYAKQVNDDQQKSVEVLEVDVIIPTKEYPPFDNDRAVTEMGLEKSEADAFVVDLIDAIESEITHIQSGILSGDIQRIEVIVHTITGTSSTLGSGGISSALISFYAAIQHRDNQKTLQVHLENVKHYLEALKHDYMP